MLLHCLSNDVYKNLARGTVLYFYTVLSLQHRSAFTACFLSQQKQKFLFRGCKCSPCCSSPHLQLLQTCNLGFHDSSLSSPTMLGHPHSIPNFTTYRLDALCCGSSTSSPSLFSHREPESNTETLNGTILCIYIIITIIYYGTIT